MSTLDQLRTEQIRLILLQLLCNAPGYQANDGEMASALAMFGHQYSRDQLRCQLAWLGEQGLIELTLVMGAIQVAKLTTRGDDAAHGRAQVPGVKRPGPGDSI